MRGLLVRVGIDHSYGGWNAPFCQASGEFVYVPIPESQPQLLDTRNHRRYEEVREPLVEFGARRGLCVDAGLRFPSALWSKSMHLDPDFEHLTYGDDGNRRGAGVARLERGDFVAFYSGLRCVPYRPKRLAYALIGLFTVDEVVLAGSVEAGRRHENAHTRRVDPRETDVILRAQPGKSGRFARALPIGEWRDRAYRVSIEVLDEWGGLGVANGYIQRSAVPPRFLEPERFLAWLNRQSIELLASNNPA